MNKLHIAPRKQDNTEKVDIEALSEHFRCYQPQRQLPSGDWGWVCTSTNNVALQLHLAFYLSPLHSFGKETLQFLKKFCFGAFLWGKKPKQAKIKPNRTKDVQLGKSLVGARKSDCSYGVLCVHRLPKKRQLSSVFRIFHFWGKLDSKQVPFLVGADLK